MRDSGLVELAVKQGIILFPPVGRIHFHHIHIPHWSYDLPTAVPAFHPHHISFNCPQVSQVIVVNFFPHRLRVVQRILITVITVAIAITTAIITMPLHLEVCSS